MIRAALLMMLVLVAGCAGRGAGLPELEATPPGPYRLGTGDEVRIIVFGQEQLSGSFAVNDSGSISMPLIGLVPAAGLTTRELEQAITDKLSEGLLVDPSVAVEVEEYRPFFILGEVQSPGRYGYVPDMTVLTGVSIGGGFTYRAEQDYVSITRKVDDEAVEFRAGRNALVQPGDVIYVFERLF